MIIETVSFSEKKILLKKYLGHLRDNLALESSLDTKDGADMCVDGLLVSVVFVCEVEDPGARLVVADVPVGSVPDSLGDIEHMDSVDAQILCPQELHLLV